MRTNKCKYKDNCQLFAKYKPQCFVPSELELIKSVSSTVLIVGEAPGEEEDKLGIPFCGKSGSLLRSIINDIRTYEERLCFTNAVLCRPDDNEPPTESMIEFCSKRYMIKLIEYLKPELIIACGGKAVSALSFCGMFLVNDNSIDENNIIHSKISDLINKIYTLAVKILNPDGSIKMEYYNTTFIYHPSYVVRKGSQQIIEEYKESIQKAFSLLKG